MVITYDDTTLFITIDDTVSLSPEALEKMIEDAKKETATYDMDTVVIKKESHGETSRYSYVAYDGVNITEKYLFNPEVFNHFKKKDQCENLWHGCEIPSTEGIYAFAKTYKAQEQSQLL